MSSAAARLAPRSISTAGSPRSQRSKSWHPETAILERQGDFAEVQGGRHAYALVAKGIFTPALPNSRRAESCMRRAPQLGIAPQGLPFLRRRAIPGHRGLHERLERARVDLLPFLDVDRPSRVAFQAGI